MKTNTALWIRVILLMLLSVCLCFILTACGKAAKPNEKRIAADLSGDALYPMFNVEKVIIERSYQSDNSFFADISYIGTGPLLRLTGNASVEYYLYDQGWELVRVSSKKATDAELAKELDYSCLQGSYTINYEYGFSTDSDQTFEVIKADQSEVELLLYDKTFIWPHLSSKFIDNDSGILFVVQYDNDGDMSNYDVISFEFNYVEGALIVDTLLNEEITTVFGTTPYNLIRCEQAY